jgi:hypothetical protein
MEIGEIKKVLKVFTEYCDGEYLEFLSPPRKARWLCHKEEDYFKIIIFDDNSVFQIGTEADTIGIELKNLSALKRRFESFTGEKL